MFESYQLKNKTNVILVPLKDHKSVTVLVMYPVGSRYEPENLRGASHFIEHLMFKGTKKRKNTLALTREIDRLGAEYNAFTGKEYTGYYIKVGEDYIKIAIDILSDMLNDSLFDSKEMEREKGVILEEIRMYKDNPIINVENIFEDLMYGNTPLGRDIAGSEKHVKNFERDEVLKFKSRYYQPKNTTIVVAGSINEKTKLYLEDFFGQAKNQDVKFKDYKPFVFSSEKKEDRVVIENKKTDQVQLMLGFPAFKYKDKKNYAASVLHTVLGGSMSSRLFIQIRERRGLAYMVRSGVERFRDTGYFYVRSGLEVKNINKAVSVIKKEIEKMTEKGVTPRELKDAKTHIRGSLSLNMEDASSQAHWFANQFLFYNNLETPEERLLRIDSVTNEDIKDVAKEIFKWNKLRIAIIGDVEKNKIKF